jgi:flavin reductase ActVB
VTPSAPPPPPPPVSSDEFRAVLGRFPSGVTVVTTRDDAGSDQGMTVSAFCSVSLEPPLILICIEKTASVHATLTTAAGFVVNVLSATQEQLARRFSIVDIDRFDGVGFSRSAEGYAILDDVLSVIECRRYAQHDAGDHTIIIGEVDASRVEPGAPLLYYRGGYAQLEH